MSDNVKVGGGQGPGDPPPINPFKITLEVREKEGKILITFDKGVREDLESAILNALEDFERAQDAK